MKALHTVSDEKLQCDNCGRIVDEGYFVEAESEIEWEKLERRFGKEPFPLFVCENCLYNEFSPLTTRIYYAGERLRVCEWNLKGDL
jgi:hypothetical protein